LLLSSYVFAFLISFFLIDSLILNVGFTYMYIYVTLVHYYLHLMLACIIMFHNSFNCNWFSHVTDSRLIHMLLIHDWFTRNWFPTDSYVTDSQLIQYTKAWRSG
jgi:hypothetical protein